MGIAASPSRPEANCRLAATPAVSLPPERPLPHDHGRAPNNPAMSTPTPLGPERRVLHVTDERAPCPLPARSLFGERVRFDHAAIDQAIWSAAREPTSAALVDCTRTPVGEVVGVARALAAKLPVVLALFEIDLPLADRATLAAVRTILVRPHRDAQLIAALGCALAGPADASATPTVASRFGLSMREHEIVDLLAGGDRISGIAKRLGLSLHTVRNNVKSAFRKCSVHSQEQLIALARDPTAAPPPMEPARREAKRKA